MKKAILSILVLSCFSISNAQELWTKSNARKHSKNELHLRKNTPKKYEVYSLNVDQFKKKSFGLNDNQTIEIKLPTINGKLERFQIRLDNALAPELAAKYPMIKSFSGKALDKSGATVKISLGTNGFYAQVFTPGKSTFYIDPYSKNNKNYIAYSRKDINQIDHSFSCEVEKAVKNQSKSSQTLSRNANDSKLRTYRIAIACTGEYAQFHLTQQGVNMFADLSVRKAAILSAMNTTITRVNMVYERDLSARLIIVADNDKLINFSASNDGLDNNQATVLINQSQALCDSEIGANNYDIGHTFSTGAGGLAGLGVLCVDGQKGRGVTGSQQPINDPFDIDYVAHEIGHQFGGNHTFNGSSGSCGGSNRNDDTAVEPGSGSTIMAYAGICSPQNVQGNSDDHFHSVSIDEMWAHMQSIAGCATETNTNNTAPVVDAGRDKTIPRLTPIALTATASDANNDENLTYNWEQTDNQIATQPPVATSTGGPLFRSYPSSTSPTRYLPKMETLLAGDTSSEWEVLPSTQRDLNFSVVVRDNHPQGGSSARDDLKLSVFLFAGPFNVTSQATASSWTAGENETITWDVANTFDAPVNCKNVNILFSTDGGLTYPITLLANTPNDGSQEITVPNTNTTTGRIMVEAADNVFFNINSAAVSIAGASASTDNFEFKGFNLYPNPSNGQFDLKFDVINTDKVSVKLFDLGGRMIDSKDYFNTATNFSERLNFNASSGLYLLKIENANKQTTRKVVIK